MTIIKGLAAIKKWEQDEERRYLLGRADINPIVSAYIKEMTDLGVPGEWHYQQFGFGYDDLGYDKWVVALFNPNNELVEYLADEETPYKSWCEAQWAVQQGDYPFTWNELSDMTRRHTEQWNQLEVAATDSK